MPYHSSETIVFFNFFNWYYYCKTEKISYENNDLNWGGGGDPNG